MDTPPAPSRLDRLRAITELLATCGPEHPTAIGVMGLDAADLDLAFKPLGQGDVVRDLAGFRAPASWEAFGVVAPATAYRLDDDTAPARVVLGVLAARDGTVTSAVHGLEPSLAGRELGRGEGRVLDACRRALGLPTAPPEQSTALWSVLHWVEAILRAVLDADLGVTPSWAHLSHLDTGRVHARAEWCVVRRHCAAGRLRIPGVPRAGAVWMDDGMFSREALSAYPTLFDMLGDLSDLLPPATFEQLIDGLCDRLADPGPARG